MLEAMVKEITLTKQYLGNEPIETVYFGGGTPSLLLVSELELIFNAIQKHYNLNLLKEVTLEANPDDINNEYLVALKNTPVNRFSLGVQSFNNKDLRYMNRAHNAEQAERSIKLLQDKGFVNITIDLIYGTPLQTDKIWKSNLDKFLQLNLNHLSSYCLTVEPKTALHQQILKNKSLAPDEDKAATYFEMLMNFMENNGFIHYEISNFAKPDYIAVHNSNYWFNKPYLGIGPSAHSYNKTERRWNVANNTNYIKAITTNNTFYNTEQLSINNRFNEYILTSLRTIWGIDNAYIKSEFGNILYDSFLKNINVYVLKHLVKASAKGFVLTNKGKLYADSIASDLFVTGKS